MCKTSVTSKSPASSLSSLQGVDKGGCVGKAGSSKAAVARAGGTTAEIEAIDAELRRYDDWLTHSMQLLSLLSCGNVTMYLLLLYFAGL